MLKNYCTVYGQEVSSCYLKISIHYFLWELSLGGLKGTLNVHVHAYNIKTVAGMPPLVRLSL